MNPFVLGNILPGEPFCNRKKEIEELARYAINCANVVIYSPRRYGKTSLVRQVMHQVTKRGFLAVYVDLFSVISKEDFIQKFLAAVIKSIGKNISSGSFMDKVKNLFSRITPSIEIKPDSISISAHYDSGASLTHLIEDIFRGLEKYLSTKKLKCLMVFDEFQEITELKESKPK
jgi:AAA+ ATPase superfamily predicted ATPase